MPGINLKKNILLGGSSRLLIMGLSFLCSWISARFLGVELKGQYSYLVTLGGFIWMVLDLGLYRSYPYLIRKNPDKLNSLLGWTILSFVLETLLLAVLGLGLLRFWNSILGFVFDPLSMLLFIGFITLTKLFMHLQSLYMGMDRIGLHSLGHILNSLTCLLLFALGYFMFQGERRLAFILGSMLLGLTVASLFFLLAKRWGNPWRNWQPRFVLNSYKFGIRVFISSLLIMLLIRADIVLIKHFLGFSEVGIYSIGAHIVDTLQTASNVVGGFLFVKLSDTADDRAKWLLMKKMLMLFFVFISFTNLGFALLGKWVLQTFYGADFVPAYGVYLWLIPASYGLSFGSLFNNYLNSKGFPVATIFIAGLVLVMNIGLNILLIPLLGIIGAAIATDIAYLLWFLLIIAYEQRSSGGQMLSCLAPAKTDWRDFSLELLSTLRVRNRNNLGKEQF